MAFERIAYLEAVVGADITQFRRGMRDIRNDLGILSETTQGLSGIARTMTYTITAPLLALGTGMAKTAMDFEANMRNINSLLQLSEGEFASLSNQIKDFGLTARGGAIGASEGFYQLVSAGYAGADAMDVFKVISKTAEAGLADLETTTKAVTATLLAYGMQGEESAWRVSNSLTRAVQVGVGTMSDFANNLPETRAVGNILGVDIEELDFAVARLTQLGFSVSEAGTRTKNVLKKLANPTEDMLELYEKLGISGGRELVGKFGLIGGLEELRKVVGENEQALTALFGESRATEGFTSLTNNIDDTNKALAEFYAGLDTATLDAWGEQSKSFAFQWDMFKSALEGVSIAIGEKILPIITPMLKGFTDWLTQIAKTNPELLDMGVKLAMLASALPPLLWFFSSFSGTLGLVTSGLRMFLTVGGAIPALMAWMSAGSATATTATTALTVANTTAVVSLGTLATATATNNLLLADMGITSAVVAPAVAGVGVASAGTATAVGALTIEESILAMSSSALATASASTATAIASIGGASVATSPLLGALTFATTTASTAMYTASLGARMYATSLMATLAPAVASLTTIFSGASLIIGGLILAVGKLALIGGALAVVLAGIGGAIDFEQIFGKVDEETNKLYKKMSDLPTQMSAEMKSNSTTVNTSELVKIEKGDSWWTVWQEQFKEDMDWETFKTALAEQGIDIKKTLQIGDMFEIQTGTMTESIITNTLASMDDASSSVMRMPKKVIELPFGITLPADIGTQLNTFFETLRNLVDWQAITTGFDDLKDSISKFLDKLGTADLTIFTIIGEGLAILAIAIGRIISNVTGGGLTILGDALESVGNILVGMTNMFSAFSKGDIEGGMKIMLEEVLKSLITGLATMIVDLMLTVAKTIESFVPSLGTSLSDSIQGIKNQVNGTVVRPEIGFEPVIVGEWSSSTNTKLQDWLVANFAGAVPTEEKMMANFQSLISLDPETMFALTETTNPTVLAHEWVNMIEESLTTEANPEARERLIGVAQTLADMYSVPFTPEFAMQNEDDPFETLQTTIDNAIANVKGNPLVNAFQKFFADNPATIGAEGTTVGATMVQETMADMQAEADALVGSVDLTPLVADLTASDTSPSTYITTQLKPLEAEFIRIFGEQGTVTTLYKNFVSGFALDTVMLQTSMNGLLASTATVFTLLVGTITIAVSLIIGKLDDLKAKIDEVAGALGGLNTTMQAVPVVGATGGNGGTGGGGGSKTINIYGASSYQQIANEASRQGVPLVGKPSRE